MEIIKILSRVAGIFGVLIYFPLLIALAMSFDAPGSGSTWEHWMFGVGNLLLGPLCLLAIFSKRFWKLAPIGFGVAILSWLPLVFLCGGQFSCN